MKGKIKKAIFKIGEAILTGFGVTLGAYLGGFLVRRC
jgi:hypothetical protein